jgi:UDP-N-acetylmuramate dehydrogenase
VSDPAVALDILARRAHGPARANGAVGPLTSYRIGGPADVLFEAATPDDLPALSEAARESGCEVLVVGRGSNMLVSDRGVRGIVVRLGGGFRWSRAEGTSIAAGAAMPLPSLATLAMHERLTGFEFAVAIPASLGGAVRMNAGAHGHEMRDVLETADVFLLDSAAIVRVRNEDAGFAYRTSALPEGSIVTAAALALAPGTPEAIVAGMDEAKEWRRATQPLNLPNGGSVFKNPPGDHAARLVESVCGKGMAVGGARVSEVHANFIVASDAATADEVYTLIRRIQRMVAESAGVELELELKLMGDFREVA